MKLYGMMMKMKDESTRQVTLSSPKPDSHVDWNLLSLVSI